MKTGLKHKELRKTYKKCGQFIFVCITTFTTKKNLLWLWVGSIFDSIEVKGSESRSVISDSVTPWTIVHGILQARILEWVAFPFSRRSSQPRDRTQISHIAGRFFISWATGKSQNTAVCSLSLLQRIFLTLESNWSLLHCRILYQLSYQGSPLIA